MYKIRKEEKNMLSKETKVLIMQNRIHTLQQRAGKENGNIVRKLQRKLRNKI